MSAKPLYGSRTAVTVTLNSLSDGSKADSSEFDNTSDLSLSRWIEVNVVGSNAAEEGSVIVYAREGLQTNNLATDENLTRIGTVTLNGTTAVQGTLRYDDVAPFYKLVFEMASSGGYALGSSGNSAYILGENIQDV